MARLSLSVPEAAEAVGVCENTLRDLIKRGEFPHRRLNGRVVVPRKALERWLNGEHVSELLFDPSPQGPAPDPAVVDLDERRQAR